MRLNRDVDRVLNSEEVRILLLEDIKSENSEIEYCVNTWTRILSKSKWTGKKRLPEDKVKVIAYKYESMYAFRTGVCCEEFLKSSFSEEKCSLENVPRSAELQGLSLDDLELLVGEFLCDGTPITTLLDAGFTLELIVDKSVLGI